MSILIVFARSFRLFQLISSLSFRHLFHLYLFSSSIVSTSLPNFILILFRVLSSIIRLFTPFYWSPISSTFLVTHFIIFELLILFYFSFVHSILRFNLFHFHFYSISSSIVLTSFICLNTFASFFCQSHCVHSVNFISLIQFYPLIFIKNFNYFSYHPF